MRKITEYLSAYRRMRLLTKQQGLAKTLKASGWKTVVIILLAYLIRDTLVYIILPLLWISR